MRYLELLGIAAVIISPFLPFGRVPVIDNGGSLVAGGYNWSDVSLFNFLTTSGGTVIAALILAAGLLMVLAKAGGQVLVITGATFIVLIAFAEGALFPLDLGISVPVLIIGSALCSSRFVVRAMEENP